jgi:predicted ATPase/DNA-binding winged helix-turn-helix (wHTH) protein
MAESYVFGSFELLPAQQGLLRHGQPVPLGSRALALLELLAEAAPESVSNRRILERVWPGVVVEESNIRVHVAALRKALGQGHAIANRPGLGYVLNAAVRRRASQAPAAAPADTPIGLPAMLTPLIGRQEAVAAIAALLQRRRLVTIVGPGGIGKTSLALAVGWEVAAHFPDGAAFVDMATLRGAGLVQGAIVTALQLRLLDHSSLPQLGEALRDRRMLLLLDNAEHLLDEVAPLAETLLRIAPGLCLLVTSREPLRSQGEAVHRLAPLEAPPEEQTRLSVAAAMRFPAVALFVDRATASQSAFVLQNEHVEPVCRLCRGLDGIPLALELAAARLDMLDVGALAERLSERLNWLTPGRRTAQPRHRTLRATLDWSHELLAPADRRVLARLSMLRGLFTLEDAVAVAACEALPAEEVLASLAELIGKSLVAANLGAGQACYRLLDTVREYAAGKLHVSGEAPATARRHAVHMLAEARRLATPAGGLDLPAECARRLDDLRAALDWGFGPEGDHALAVALTTASQPAWYQLSLMDEYRRQAERALQATAARPGGDPRAEMQLLATAGPAIFNVLGSVPSVRDAFSRARDIAARLGDVAAERRALWGIWLHCFGTGDYAEAIRCAETYGAAVRGDDPVFMFDRIMALSQLYSGHIETAIAHTAAPLAEGARHEGPGPTGYQYEQRVVTEAVLARALWLRGFPERARHHARQSIEAGRASGHMLSLCFSITLGAGPVSVWLGEAEEARLYAGELAGLAARHVLPFWYRHGLVLQHAARAMDGPAEEPDAAFLAGQAWNAGHVEALAAFGLGHVRPDGLARYLSGPTIWCTAEVMRLEAARLLRIEGLAAAAEAEALLARAMEIAAAQGALAWELRIAHTQGLLYQAQRRGVEGQAMVASRLARFTEGLDTPDIAAARAFVEGTARVVPRRLSVVR